MRKTWSVLFCFTLFSLSVFSPGSAAEIKGQNVNITVSQSFVSRYIWRGFDLSADNDPSYQPSVDIAFEDLAAGTDVSFNVWGAIPIGSGHEISTEADYSMTLSHDFEMFNVSSGYIYYDYVKANRYSDAQEVWLSMSLFKIPRLPFDVSFDVLGAYDFEAADGGPENGWYYSWGFSTTVPLAKTALTQQEQGLDASVVNWGIDGFSSIHSSALYATEFSLSSSYTFGPVSVTPGIQYVWNYEKEINPDNEFLASLDVSYSF